MIMGVTCMSWRVHAVPRLALPKVNFMITNVHANIQITFQNTDCKNGSRHKLALVLEVLSDPFLGLTLFSCGPESCRT